MNTVSHRDRNEQGRSFVLSMTEEGEGSSLLFLHALGASGRYWQGQLGPLPRTHRCLLPDLLGFGRSPKPHLAYTVADHLAALRATLMARHATGRPLVLVGHSLGAVLALEYAAAFLNDVMGVIVLGLPCYASPAEARAYIGEHGQWMAQITIGNGRLAHGAHLLLTPLRPLLTWLSRRRIFPFPAAVVADALSHTWESYSGTLAHCVLSHDLAPALAAVAHLPILALHGRDDPAAPLHGVQALAAQWTNIELRVLAGGHHLFLTQHDACLAAIGAYLDDLHPHGSST